MAITVVCDKNIPFLSGVLESAGGEVSYLGGAAIANADLVDADALVVRTRSKCNEQLLAGTKVKFVASATIGFDHIDTDYLAKNSIKWSNSPGCNSDSVVQYVLSVLLSLGVSTGSTIGVIGVGNVGKRLAKLAKIFGFNVLLSDPPRAEREGMEGKAVLDVWQNEPNIDLELLDLVSFATPHIAGYSQDGKANATMCVVKNLAEFFQIEKLKSFQIKLPQPENYKITLNSDDQLKEAVLHTYSVAEDDSLLRSCPAKFEQLRNEYRVRREFGAYWLESVEEKNCSVLKKAGFNL